jgi:hypothetical protein
MKTRDWLILLSITLLVSTVTVRYMIHIRDNTLLGAIISASLETRDITETIPDFMDMTVRDMISRVMSPYLYKIIKDKGKATILQRMFGTQETQT